MCLDLKRRKITGHDISSFNKAKEEIGYVHFSMGSPNAPLFYDILGACEYYAGVSGNGGVATISPQKLDKITGQVVSNAEQLKELQTTSAKISATQEKHEGTLDLLARRSIDQEAALKRIN